MFSGSKKKKYQIVFVGLSGDADDFVENMVRMGAPAETVKKMIQKAPVILKKDTSWAFSTRYSDAIHKAGGMTDIQETGYFKEAIHPPISIVSFKEFLLCPQCGFKQQKVLNCARCGSRILKSVNEPEQKNVAGH